MSNFLGVTSIDHASTTQPFLTSQQARIQPMDHCDLPSMSSSSMLVRSGQCCIDHSNSRAHLRYQNRIDVDCQTESNHDTALTLACAGGHEELVLLLLQRNAHIEHRDKKGFTPLILAGNTRE
jgi:ankyrin repeat protein